MKKKFASIILLVSFLSGNYTVFAQDTSDTSSEEEYVVEQTTTNEMEQESHTQSNRKR